MWENQKKFQIFSLFEISHFTSPPHTYEHNGTTEHVMPSTCCWNRALFTSFYFSSITLFALCFSNDVYLINHLCSSMLSFKSPLQILFHRSPKYKCLKPFWCLCYPWLWPYAMSKLQPRSIPYIFLSYSTSNFCM